jgi:hypothetical protein
LKKTLFVVIVLAVWGAGARQARAQGHELLNAGFVNVDAGAEPQRRTITASSSFSLYDETATVTAIQRIRNGVVFDVSGGMRIRRNLAVGAGFSQFGRAGTGAVTTSIPHPGFFDRPLVVSTDASDLAHTERTIHGRVTWFMPISDTLDISVSGGPSFIHVVQGLATSITVLPGTQSVTVVKETHSGNAIGVNGGIDANYMVRSRLGIGLFVRYTAGTLNLPTAPDFKVGGIQTGLGLRARF